MSKAPQAQHYELLCHGLTDSEAHFHAAISLFTLSYTSSERCAGHHTYQNRIKLPKPKPNIFWSGLIINTFITSFWLDPPWRGVLFMSWVPASHLTALSSASTRAAGRASSQCRFSPHVHYLGNCLNCLPWSMCIWTDGKYLHSCQQKPGNATKIYLEWEKKEKKNNSWEYTQVCCR